MTDKILNNNYKNNLCECPRCHIKLNAKEIRIHNIKCRMENNKLEKNNNTKSTKEFTYQISSKDEYKNFMDKIPDMQIDDKNINSIMKNFILILGNKIELLENNIYQINEQMKKLKENNSSYFKKINDNLDNINKKYFNTIEIQKKKEIDNNKRNNYKKSLFYKNETDINIYETKNNNIKIPRPRNNIRNSPILYEGEKNLKKEKTNIDDSKNLEKKKFISEKNIININKEEEIYLNDNISNKNQKYIDTIKREKKKDNKYKEKILKTKRSYNINFYNNDNIDNLKKNSLNIMDDEKMVNYDSNNGLAMNMRRSLSYGDLNHLNNKDNNVNIENGGIYENCDNGNNDILVDSLDIIMKKISYLEDTLIKICLNPDENNGKNFNVKSKELEYSNSDSFHSGPSN